MFARRATETEREWHSHMGWFEKIDGFRRLTQVNIDAVGAIPPREHILRPSIGIYTMMQDEANIDQYAEVEQELDRDAVISHAEALHVALKKLFLQIVVNEVAQRIGLAERGKE